MVMLHDLRPPGTGTDGILSDLRPEVRLLECIASEEGGQAAHDQGPPPDREGRQGTSMIYLLTSSTRWETLPLLREKLSYRLSTDYRGLFLYLYS